ncbi:MAG: FkbM family methyltransferase, partial [Frankiaceae bacterium]|nr:FkbM family methyltransferase [Frankiaceae bacterium]
PVRIEAERLEGLPYAEFYGGHAAVYRLLLPELLPDVPRVLYLDADTLVLDDLSPLWNLDLDRCLVAASTNPLYRHMERRLVERLGLPDRRAYFNSGVLLFDLELMRSEGADQELLAWATANRDLVSWPDQDVLNAVLWRRRLPLHPRWNAVPGLWALPSRDLPWPMDQVEAARRNPAIAHFVGPYKPWHYRCKHPYRSAYHAHLAQTAVVPRPRVGGSLRDRLLRPLPPLAQLTAENGTLEVRTELKHQIGRTTLGAEARLIYRQVRGRPTHPLTAVLDALDASTDNVTFIQIGSNDGDRDDPLRQFILAGQWSGLMVEPIPDLYERLSDNYRGRPGIQTVCAAIGDHDGTAEFFAIARSEDDADLPSWYDQIGSWSREHILKHAEYIPDLDQRIITMEVPCMTFESLCRQQGIGVIDLLHIDAEGYDLEVLREVDFDLHKPRLVLFEYKHLSESDLAATRKLLDSAGYDSVDINWDTLAIRRDATSPTWSRLARAWKYAERNAVAAGG